MKTELLETVNLIFNPQNNGGETVSLTVNIHTNGDDIDHIFTTAEFNLQSYCNSARISFNGIDPEQLRKFADDIENAIKRNS